MHLLTKIVKCTHFLTHLATKVRTHTFIDKFDSESLNLSTNTQNVYFSEVKCRNW